MKHIDEEIERLTINVEQLVDRLQQLQEENHILKQKTASLTRQLTEVYEELAEARQTIRALREDLQAAQGKEERHHPSAPMILTHEEKLLIRHQLEHLLELVNLELQRLS